MCPLVGAAGLAGCILSKATVRVDALVALGCCCGSRGVELIQQHGDLAFEGQLEQLEEVLPGQPQTALPSQVGRLHGN